MGSVFGITDQRKVNEGRSNLSGQMAVFLSIREESGEVIIGASEGVIKCRAFRKKGSEAERWNTAEIIAVVGLPWPGVELSEYQKGNL